MAELEKEDLEPDPEDMVRPGAAVRIQEHDETKFLGPSSGIAITRLVMQLAKQFTDAKSITDIVTQNDMQTIKETFNEEGDKPTSKIYPLTSDVAAEELPQRDLTNLLVDLFDCKGEICIYRGNIYMMLTIQSRRCIPSCTNQLWRKMSRMSTMGRRTRFKISRFEWSLPSVCKEWTPNTPVLRTATTLQHCDTSRPLWSR
jgi:hypothetical protein